MGGNLLYLTGSAEVIWEGAEITAYEGAERLLRFHLKRGVLSGWESSLALVHSRILAFPRSHGFMVNTAVGIVKVLLVSQSIVQASKS